MYSYTTNTQNMKVDFMHRTIIVSKKFMNQASKVGTSEYDLMLRMYRELPTFAITMKETARSTYRPVQPTYSAMQEYIQITNRIPLRIIWSAVSYHVAGFPLPCVPVSVIMTEKRWPL